MVVSTDKLARFVGLEAYAAAGGLTRADLFGDRVYLESGDILRQLATDKLEAAADELRREGWGWVETTVERDWQFTNRCGEIESHPIDVPQEIADEKAKLDEEFEAAETAYQEDDGEDEARSEELENRRDDLERLLDEINEKLEAYVAFDPDEMKLAGCYVYINGNGVLCVDKGLVKPEDKKAAAKAKAGEPGQASVEKPKGLSESLKRDVEVYRLGAAQAEIAKHPAIAFDLLVFKVASNILTMRSPTDGPNVRFEREFAGTAGKDARDFLKAQMEPVAEGLPKAWLEAGSEADQFLAFQQLSDYQKQAILAYCVAVTLQPKLDTGGRPTAYEVALAQSGANVADYWRPTKDAYLSRITKEQLLEIGAGLLGGQKGKQWATTNANEKKGDIAGELHRVFNSDELPGMTPEQAERVKNWLPSGMAFREASEPTPTKAKKGKKAA
jgi:ParB family chromosome partitioning protein